MRMTDKPFMHDNFLLDSEPARRLFHDYAESMPIVDYHCHLPPQQVSGNYQFRDLAEAWLGGDHYKWRVMRANGVDERYCTGNASPWEKFQKWAETVPATLRNPLYHWTHLELRRPFGITDRLLSPETAKSIWNECNAKLATPEFFCRGIMKRMNVRLVCTTDDPADSLEHHKAARDDAGFDVQMLPAWRPDKAMDVDGTAGYNTQGYLPYVKKLSKAADVDIKDYPTFWEALRRRHAFFVKMGCRVSDHGLETIFAEDVTERKAAEIFAKILTGKAVRPDEVLALKSDMLYQLGVMDHAAGLRQQFHLGALRNNNSRLYKKLGPDTGFDSISDVPTAHALGRLLDRLDSTDQLAPTVLYNLNPADNELLATMIGNFQDGSMPGKMQFGSGWWFLDQIDGMTRQIEALSQLGLLSRFIGMLTDSRSFLSYTRHEYFRRLLCNILGRDIERGLIPADYGLLGGLLRDVCYNNAVRFFGFDLPEING
jgi:glucuronate isomerase